MKIHVKLTGRLRGRDPGQGTGAELEINDGATAAGLLHQLQLQDPNYLFVLNDNVINKEAFQTQLLHDGDQITISSSIKGG